MRKSKREVEVKEAAPVNVSEVDPGWLEAASIVAGISNVESIRTDPDGNCWVLGEGKEVPIGIVIFPDKAAV